MIPTSPRTRWHERRSASRRHLPFIFTHPRTGRRTLATLFSIFALCGIELLLHGAAAQPPDTDDPTLAPWFQSLRQPGTGISCCSVADCRLTDYRTTPDGYEAMVEDRWLVVPPEKVLQRVGNPTGKAVVCYTPVSGILCFVRPSEA